jgi:hypothetical protein
MSNTTRLITLRNELETYLDDSQYGAINTDVELAVYDSILRSRVNYENQLHSDLNGILDLISSSQEIQKNLGIPGEDFKIKSDFLLYFDKPNQNHLNHIFGGNFERSCVGNSIFDSATHGDIGQIAYEDNAIIVDEQGLIYATNVQLVDVKPALQEPLETDISALNKQFGFFYPVHTRHFSSLGASHHMPETILYTLGERGHVRRFHNGKITFSSVNEER